MSHLFLTIVVVFAWVCWRSLRQSRREEELRARIRNKSRILLSTLRQNALRLDAAPKHAELASHCRRLLFTHTPDVLRELALHELQMLEQDFDDALDQLDRAA